MPYYQPRINEDICETATHMVALANTSQDNVHAKFNGIFLNAHPGDTSEAITTFYQAELHRQSENAARRRTLLCQKRVDEKETEIVLLQSLLLALYRAEPGTGDSAFTNAHAYLTRYGLLS